MARGKVDYFFRKMLKLTKIYNPMLQKGLSEVTNSEVNTEASVKTSTTTTKISASRNNEPSKISKNVSSERLKVNIKHFY